MFDAILLEAGFNLFNDQVQCIAMEYSNTCTDAIAKINQSVEVYETACLLEAYNYVEESTNEYQLRTVCEGRGSEFIEKIVEIMKTVIEKIKKAAGLIGEKIKNFFTAVSEKFDNIGSWKPSGKENDKPFPNGFKIKFSKGFDCYKSFEEANSKIIDRVSKLAISFAEECTKPKPNMDTFESKYKDLCNIKPVKEEINDTMNCKVKFDKSPEEWCEKAFEFKQMGENWIPNNAEIKEMIDECNVHTEYFEPGGIGDVWRKKVISDCSKMSNVCKAVEKMSGRAVTPDFAKGIKELSQKLIQFSEFGVIVNQSIINFTASKFTAHANYLKNNGLAH